MKPFKTIQGAQQGFTLIELMIVVAIVAILAAVSLPAYHNYVIKSKLSNVLSSVSPLKTAVGVCANEQGNELTSCDSGEMGIPVFTQTKEVVFANVSDGEISIVLASSGFGRGIDGKTITMTPTRSPDSGTAITWKITTNIVPFENQAAYDMLVKNNASL